MPTDTIAQHTPGPWKVEIPRQRGNFGGAFSVTAGGAFVIASRAGVPDCADESLANARLIAAAPSMLAALEMVLAIICDKELCGHFTAEEIREVAEKAIAKAEGRNA